MHISEGILSPQVLMIGGAITAVGTAIGLKNIDGEKLMTSALLTSTFFVASLIHVPVGPANIHLILTGVMGLALGWICFPAILVALFLQVIFFQYGGFTVIGVNTANMALPAIIIFYFFQKPIRNGGKSQKIASFLGGFLAVFLSSLFMALAVGVSDSGFIQTAKLTFVSHIPLMIIEGIITMFIISFIAKVQPQILNLEN
ncbi:MAG: cobalt transporter CbiM [Desulfotalea sp.]